MACALFLAFLYALLPFMEIIAPYAPNDFHEDGIFAPPQGLGLPAPLPAALLLGLGLVGYLGAWAWLIWLKFFGRPDSGGG